MIGIDLGTTNSCVALRDPFGGATSVPVAVGPNPPYDTVLRSAVYDPCGEQPAIGGQAVSRFEREQQAAPFLITFKPELEEQRLRTRVVSRNSGALRYDPMAEAMVESRGWTVEEIGHTWSRDELVTSTALLAQHLMREAVSAGGELDRVLLGTPISFSSTARKRVLCGLRAARDAAGRPFFASWRDLIERVSFVLEPVAVAAGPIRDAIDVADRETVLVFDHGGGTLDLALLEYDRLPGFERPVPVRQLSALGSDVVAGRAFDAAFQRALLGNRRRHAALQRLHPQVVTGLVEEVKIELSTADTYELLGVPVTREEFEHGVAHVVDDIEQVVRRLLAHADLGVEQVDRVVMSGGSSCVPCVQDRLRTLFAHLDDDDDPRLSMPIAPDGVEAAITDVARGLVSFAGDIEDALEQVVLWNIDVLPAGAEEFLRLIDRGTPFEHEADGRLALRRTVRIPSTSSATSVGVFEDQLGHRFMSGLANVRPLADDALVEITLRPDAAVPGVSIVDDRGRELATGDIEKGYSEAALTKWFGQDVAALPLVNRDRLRSVPLERLLRVGDVVEGIDRQGRPFHGTIKKMRHIPTGKFWDAMRDFASLPDLVLEIGPQGEPRVTPRRVDYGGIRLAQRWVDA